VSERAPCAKAVFKAARSGCDWVEERWRCGSLWFSLAGTRYHESRLMMSSVNVVGVYSSSSMVSENWRIG